MGFYELLPRHVVALDTIRELGKRYGPGRWVLVGGMMVMILGREYHTRAQRADGTKDADILIDTNRVCSWRLPASSGRCHFVHVSSIQDRCSCSS